MKLRNPVRINDSIRNHSAFPSKQSLKNYSSMSHPFVENQISKMVIYYRFLIGLWIIWWLILKIRHKNRHCLPATYPEL